MPTNPNDWICTGCGNEDQEEFELLDNGIAMCLSCGWSESTLRRSESEKIDAEIALKKVREAQMQQDFAAALSCDDDL